MRILPQKTRLAIPGGGDFTLEYNGGHELVSWSWHLKDPQGNLVPFSEPPSANPPPEGTFYWRRRIGEATREIICPVDPVHAYVNLFATATLKDKAGSVHTETTPDPARINFAPVWGGFMKASYPYPADWDKPWKADAHGERALVLMFDLINQMPDELRRAAGSIPITRSAGLPFASAFHPPYIHDSIIITDDYVTRVTPNSSTLTHGDMQFIYVVLHEIAHAVTYQKCSVNVHGIIVGMHRALRHPHVIMRGGRTISVALGGLLSLIHMLLFGDFVSGFAKVARWELTAWYFKIARLGYIPIDLIYWLSHLSETTNWPAVNPNVITGWKYIGCPLGGLKNVSPNWDSDLIAKLQNSEFRLWEVYQEAEVNLANMIGIPLTPPEVAAARLHRDEAEKAWKLKRKELDKRLSSAGAVSNYATTDVLEDIAETITAITFGAAQLNAMRAEAFVTHDSAGNMTDGFARRRRYLMQDAGLFPRRWTPIEPGRYMRGSDAFDHLDEWRILL